MALDYKKKLLEEIEEIPEGVMSRIYRVVHLLKIGFLSKGKEAKTNPSLKGIWKGSQIEDTLFLDAKSSLFSYESR